MSVDYAKMPVTELRKIATELDITNRSKLTKIGLITAIQARKSAVNRMSNTMREVNYIKQNGTNKLTTTQKRKLRKSAKRLMKVNI